MTRYLVYPNTTAQEPFTSDEFSDNPAITIGSLIEFKKLIKIILPDVILDHNSIDLNFEESSVSFIARDSEEGENVSYYWELKRILGVKEL